MNRYLWLLGVFVAALVVVLIGAAPIAAMSFQFSLLFVLPLAMLVAAMFAALGATWMGDWLVPTGERRHLVRIVKITEIAAVVLSVLLVALVFWLEGLGALTLASLPSLFLFGFVVLAIVATVATGRYRDRTPDRGRDGLATLGFLGLTGLLIVWVQAFVGFVTLLPL